MKRSVIIIFIMLAGLGVLAYPTISNYLSEKNGSYAIATYEEAVANEDEQAIQAAWDEAVRYNESLSGQPVHDPFLEGTGMAMQDNYHEVLKLNDTMGYVEIPKISVNLPIYHGTADEVLQKGVGHLEGSSIPVGGEGTHSVLTGHTGLTHAKIFTDLTELGKDDLFYVHVLNQTLAYRVDQIKVIEPENTDDLRRVDGMDYCTLLTCTPYAVNSHRLLVRGVRTEYIPEEKEAIAPVSSGTDEDRIVLIVAVIATAVMVVVVIFALHIHRRRMEKQERIRRMRQEIGKW